MYLNYGEALEADFLRYWHIDITDVSLRRMRNLYERLPMDSETLSEIGEYTSEARMWNVNTYMLANIIDAVNYVAWSVQATASKHPPRKPKPIKRPDLTKTKSNKKMWPGRTIVQKEGSADG